MGVDSDTMLIVLLAVIIICFILAIWMIVLSVKLKKVNRNYRKMIGETGVADLEHILIDAQERLHALKAAQQKQESVLQTVQKQLKRLKAHAGIFRYNAFNDKGSDLSFSIALVDEYESGFVLSGIHSREQTYIYAKPLENGNSPYSLTPEEKEAMARAARKPEEE